MKSLTFDQANKLPWTNDLLEEVVAMSLFLGIIETREEAISFWSKKDDLEAKYLPIMNNLQIHAAKMRKVMDVQKLGISRDDTDRVLSLSQIMMLCN